MSQSNRKRHQYPRGALALMRGVYKYTIPETRNALNEWRAQAEAIPDEELRTQALASIRDKQFHCEGGTVYALADLPNRHILIPLIVSYQTISDYLDNLCDRSTSMDPDDFRLLHQSMLDAVDPEAVPVNYYALREEQDDGGYLRNLVTTCQELTRQLPGYASAKRQIQDLAGLYTDLQVYKHIKPELRETALLEWWSEHRHRTPQFRWNEFAAATGSTLGVFMLFLAASDEQLTEEQAVSIHTAYFPHVCALHIMLDYLIDQGEDRIEGDLNFCNYYENVETMLYRIAFIVEMARSDVQKIPGTAFHRMIIEGLIAIYLSDPKVSEQQEVRDVSKRLMKNSPITRVFFFIFSRWIRKHM